jgi:hypothetical protein
MSFVQRQVAHCDICGHEWIVVATHVPTHCAKCRSRQWNQAPEPQRRHPVIPASPAALDPKR